MPRRHDHAEQGCVVGILADPEAPTKLAKRLARTLPGRWADGGSRGASVTVEVASEPFTTGSEDAATLLSRIETRAERCDWDVTVGLTELPLHAQHSHLVADINTRTRSVLVSLPAVGGLRLRAAALSAMSDLVTELVEQHAAAQDADSSRFEDILTGRLSPIRAGATDENEAADLRFVASGAWGRLRLLAGMVRTNQPWRLVPGLSKALAAALATGAIATVNSSIWTLSSTLSVTRLAVAMVGSIAMIVTWLIVDANLWHRRADDSSPEDRQKRALYNASTVVTVACGGLICYAALYLINVLWALFIVNGQAFQRLVGHPMSGSDYLTLSWLVASAATVGGALGSGLESDEAVRAAAFAKREQERRQMLEDADEPAPSD